MDVKVKIAVIAASVTVVGWIINHILQASRDKKAKRKEALLKFTEKQLEELYGPLAFLVLEGRRTFMDLLEILGRDSVFIEGTLLSEEEQQTWLFWAENDFLPRNEKIKELVQSKTHLIHGPEFSDSFVHFLDHCNSWRINHLRWKENGVEYSLRSKINWPKEFSEMIITDFLMLKKRHYGLLRYMSGDGASFLEEDVKAKALNHMTWRKHHEEKKHNQDNS